MAVRDGITKLSELSGSGDNVLVKAAVTHIQELNNHKPYQKGLLRDGSLASDEVRPFVVYDENLKLEKGDYYVLNGKDHAYDRYEEIQLLLGEDTYVENLSDD